MVRILGYIVVIGFVAIVAAVCFLAASKRMYILIDGRQPDPLK